MIKYDILSRFVVLVSVFLYLEQGSLIQFAKSLSWRYSQMSSLNKLLVYYFYECYFYLSTVLKSEIRNMRLINTFFVYKFLAISCTSVFVLCIVRAKLNSYFAKVFPLFTFHSSFRFAWRRYFWLLNGILCIFQSISLLHLEVPNSIKQAYYLLPLTEQY